MFQMVCLSGRRRPSVLNFNLMTKLPGRGRPQIPVTVNELSQTVKFLLRSHLFLSRFLTFSLRRSRLTVRVLLFMLMTVPRRRWVTCKMNRLVSFTVLLVSGTIFIIPPKTRGEIRRVERRGAGKRAIVSKMANRIGQILLLRCPQMSVVSLLNPRWRAPTPLFDDR